MDLDLGYLMVLPTLDPLDYLPEGYVVMDYMYILEGPALFTYHRDVTSSKTVLNTQHPTYTFLTYNYDGDFLSVCPESHKNWSYTLPVTLRGMKGIGILFDCDLVHGGLDGPKGVDRRVRQYKIAHKDDLHLLNHLEGVNMCKRGSVVNPCVKGVLRVFSYIFLVPIQWLFLPLIQRAATSSLGRFLQWLVPVNHYITPHHL